MRAKDYLEIYKNELFHDDLLRVICDLMPYRRNYEYTKAYFNKNLIEDLKPVYIESKNKDHVFDPDEDLSIAPNIHPPLGYDDELFDTFRIELFKAVLNDQSFGYLQFLLIRVTDKFDFDGVQNIDLSDWYPDDKIIEKAINDYQDDYPKYNLEEILIYCDLNYKFYKNHNGNYKKSDLWVHYFNQSYALFDVLRTKILTPFNACDIIIKHFETNKNGIAFIVPLVIELLTQYNYDFTEKQLKSKTILVDEIKAYYRSYTEDFMAELSDAAEEFAEAEYNAEIHAKTIHKNTLAVENCYTQSKNEINGDLILQENNAPSIDINTNSISDSKLTKSELLIINLTKFGFFSLESVKCLSEANQKLLIDKMTNNGIPYTVAMFEYIKYFKFLDSQHFKTIKERNIQIANWLNTNERYIRGNKNVLDVGTTENKKRYTAHLHKETVIKDYDLLK